MSFNTALRVLSISLATLTLTGCVPRADWNTLKARYADLQREAEPLQAECKQLRASNADLTRENASLRAEVEEYKYGANRLFALIEQAYSTKDYKSLQSAVDALLSRHPEYPKCSEARRIMTSALREQEESLAKAKTEEAERKKLAELNKTGVWRVRAYVDAFKNPTPDLYVSNEDRFDGTFSNSATTDSELSASLLVDEDGTVAISLYEYGRNSPVKAYGTENYTVIVQDKDKERHTFSAFNSSDRLIIESAKATVLHKMLAKGGKVEFHIISDQHSVDKYHFVIPNSEYYGNALRLLKLRKT